MRENVAFGLKNRKLNKETIREETDRFLKMMQIYQFADRLPNRLSGGQQQRVALARALVIKPDVLLMDEPLSNLDAKLRLEMRRVIRNIQREIGITTVYVTHDQEEAMSISDTIAVMKDGVIHHIGQPKEIYQRQSTLLKALTGEQKAQKGQVLFNGMDVYEHYEVLRNMIGVVPQNDVVHADLTVRQTLQYAAELRFAKDVSKKEWAERIVEVLEDLDLTKHV